MIEEIVKENTTVIVYNPNEEKNIPKFFNEKIENLRQNNCRYVIFVFEDLWNAAKNKDDVISEYVNFVKDYDMPYAIYPYYNSFNRVKINDCNIPTPKAEIHCIKNDKRCNIIANLSIGLLVLDLVKLEEINFKFNEEYHLFFYLFDLLTKSALSKKTSSFNFYTDLYNSWRLFNDFEATCKLNYSEIGNEKSSYMENVINRITNDTTSHNINDLADQLKKIQESLT